MMNTFIEIHFTTEEIWIDISGNNSLLYLLPFYV